LLLFVIPPPQEDVWALCVMLLIPLTWTDPISWADTPARVKDLESLSRPKKVACYTKILNEAKVSPMNPVRKLIE
jgi:hypothetical protein